MYDHVDQRVGDPARVRPLYDALMRAMGCTRISEDAQSVGWYNAEDPKRQPFFSLVRDGSHRPNQTRIAFRAAGRQDVDRLAEIALRAGARHFEAPHECIEYTPRYYAAFFDDADGNKLEICWRD
jgi:hypothetical protein